MDLWRVSLSTTSEAADAVSVALEDIGALAVEIEDRADWVRKLQAPQFGEWVWEKDFARLTEGAFVHGYFEYLGTSLPNELQPRLQARLEQIRASGLEAGSLQYEWEKVESESYLDVWKADYHAVSVSDQMTIVPSWEKEQHTFGSDHIVLVIDPGVAFGTGTHQTTLLCLRALITQLQSQMDVLDIGTGTGILAIAAAKLGARHVVAADLDEVAVRVARDNVLTNDVLDRVQVIRSDLLQEVPEHGYHLITANLLVNLVQRILPVLYRYLAQNGVVLFSGIVKSQVEQITEALENAKLELLYVEYLDDWAVVCCRKKG
ncbi:50S ribosomal protein L11 methyltransferase [Sulfoacidibacillus thermotolerans]|uniref:Ribosomal protein L11 methyltransferase n=1 Tax=Sulfoacidibacillus thermotolerans TaxID=1765684 RepID=A0A2U3D7C9_SULT2|nr:50S ribosomal protein L11 methyltransferase [Sulfoacidibacillus thermotolerans]PWI57171.1 ribosomal protein L11 methyltransferase [Sulfoacidibacillus thermotolerans]